ncbi:MAG: DUF4105 domain-containing protein [Patescibacteria group bacterium]|nr:DUF4105 domain-containing protein [Patescibacteria group bacterium]
MVLGTGQPLGAPAAGRQALGKINPDLVKWAAPSNDREWTADQAVLPFIEFHGNQVSVRNIRNCEYRTVDDYDVHHYDKTFDLDRLESVDFVVVPFEDIPGIAHTMLSFGFRDQGYLGVSVEIRKERGESYSPVKGFFRQYELMYVLADERDLILKQSLHYLCDVLVYRSSATPAQCRDLLLDVFARVNKLHEEPEFYHTVANNCTTNLRNHVNRLAPDRVPYDYRVLLPAYSDRLAFDLGLLERRGTFEETRAAAKVNYHAYLHESSPDFSEQIRLR